VHPLLSGIAHAQGVEVLELERDVEGVDLDDLRFSKASRSNSTSDCITSNRYNVLSVFANGVRKAS
jgi:hypothetical protein